jgi:hypothetical protein
MYTITINTKVLGFGIIISYSTIRNENLWARETDNKEMSQLVTRIRNTAGSLLVDVQDHWAVKIGQYKSDLLLRAQLSAT